jgi:hypothetical protein
MGRVNKPNSVKINTQSRPTEDGVDYRSRTSLRESSEIIGIPSPPPDVNALFHRLLKKRKRRNPLD